MKLDYITIDYSDLVNNPPVCQCGTKLLYSDKLHKLVCENPNCIKQRIQSVLSTLRAIDRLAKNRGIASNLKELAESSLPVLIQYVEKFDIQYGAELITLGNSLESLGQLGSQLGNIIDTLQFEIRELGTISGSELLSTFNIDITKLTDNQRQAVLEINTQLGIDGTIWLASVLYDEYLLSKTNIITLTNYLTLIRPAKMRRSSNIETDTIINTDELFNELQDLDNIEDILAESVLAQSSITNVTTPITEEEQELINSVIKW